MFGKSSAHEAADLRRRLDQLCKAIGLFLNLAEPTEEQIYRFVRLHEREMEKGNLPHKFDYNIIVEPDLEITKVPRLR